MLYKALIKRDFGLIDEAEECTDEAVKLCPDFAEALYQNAQYNALLNKPDKAIPLLRKTIEMDVNYCEKIHNEKAFDKIRTQVNAMFEELRDEQKQKANIKYETLAKKLKAFNNLINEIKNQEPFMEIDDFAINKYIRRITDLMRRNTFRDYRETNTLLENLFVLQRNLTSDIKTKLKKIIESYNSNISKIEYGMEQRTKKSLKKVNLVWWFGIPISILLAISGCGRRVAIPRPSFLDCYWPFFSSIIIMVAVYFTLCSTFKTSGKRKTPEIISTESSIECLQDILSKLERM